MRLSTGSGSRFSYARRARDLNIKQESRLVVKLLCWEPLEVLFSVVSYMSGLAVLPGRALRAPEPPGACKKQMRSAPLASVQ